MDAMIEHKPTKKEIREKERTTEEHAAKSMAYEAIVQNIAAAKKAVAVIQGDINDLVKKKAEQEALISKMHRILNYKKKQAGA